MGRRAQCVSFLLGTALALMAPPMTHAAGPPCGVRVPQVQFGSGNLQAYLDVMDGGIHVLTDQLNFQVVQSNAQGSSDFTVTLRANVKAAGEIVGVYNGGALGTSYLLLPAFATDGWFAVCSFSVTGRLTVYLYDASPSPVFQGATVYTGLNRNAIGLFLQNTAGTFYSEDILNAGAAPQALLYAGTGVNTGGLWVCFQTSPYGAASSTFAGAVLTLEPPLGNSLQPQCATPARTTSWGSLKAIYR